MATNLTPVFGAAASAVYPLLLGPVRDGTVLGAFSRAVIIGVKTGSGPRVVSLLARGAASVPNGVRLTGLPAFDRVRAGAPASIGAGSARVGDLEVRVVRSWSTRAPRINPDGESVAAVAAAAAELERGVPPGALGRLEVALLRSAGSDRCGPALDAAVDGLVGLGRGLTPGGDDVLAGLLIGLRAVGRADVAARIAARVLPGVAARTTLLSADLLRLAAAGEACLEVLALLRAIHRPSAARVRGAGPPVTDAINRLLSIGHTSGADLASGLAFGLHLHPVARDAGACARGHVAGYAVLAGLESHREAAMTAAGQGTR